MNALVTLLFFGAYALTRKISINSDEQTSADIGKFDERYRNVYYYFAVVGILRTWIAGGTAGMVFWTIMMPVDVVKSRTQVLKSNKSFLNYSYSIIRNEGV